MTYCGNSWGRARLGMVLALGLAATAYAAPPTFDYAAFGGLRNEPGQYLGHGFGPSISFSDSFGDFIPYPYPNQTELYPVGMSWGRDPPHPEMPPFDGKSGIGLRYVTGQVEVDGQSEEFGTIVHFNCPIYYEFEGPVPTIGGGMEMKVAWNLRLYEPGYTAMVLDLPLEFGLYEWETRNWEIANPPPCPRSVPGTHVAMDHTYSSDGNNQTVCDDAFTFEASGEDAPRFDYQGEAYQVNVLGFFVSQIDMSTDPPTYQCTDQVAGGGATPTFWSPEGMSNAACVRFTVTRVPGVEIAVDVKPTSCPNPINAALNPNSGAVLPAAILGTADLDAMLVDPGTARLCLEGSCVAPLRWSYEMAAAPHDGAICEDELSCTTENDDYVDLALKFSYNEVLDGLGLRDLVTGETRCVTLRAELYDGTVLEGRDVIWIVGGEDAGE